MSVFFADDGSETQSFECITAFASGPASTNLTARLRIIFCPWFLTSRNAGVHNLTVTVSAGDTLCVRDLHIEYVLVLCDLNTACFLACPSMIFCVCKLSKESRSVSYLHSDNYLSADHLIYQEKTVSRTKPEPFVRMPHRPRSPREAQAGVKSGRHSQAGRNAGRLRSWLRSGPVHSEPNSTIYCLITWFRSLLSWSHIYKSPTPCEPS